jgi:hypothetical protein
VFKKLIYYISGVDLGGGVDCVASHPPSGEAKHKKIEKDWEYYDRNKANALDR